MVAAVDHNGISAGDAEQCDGKTAKTRRLWSVPWYCDDGGLAARRMKPDGLEAKV